MAENDTHYNGTSDISDNDAAAPLPELEEEKAVYPDDAANIPVAPLPDPGEGGPVYPGNSTTGAIGGNWDWGSNGNNHWGHPGNSWGNSFLPLTPTNPAISPRYYGQVPSTSPLMVLRMPSIPASAPSRTMTGSRMVSIRLSFAVPPACVPCFFGRTFRLPLAKR